MNDDTAIKISDLSKTFKLPHEKSSSVKNSLINLTRGKRGYEKQKVLSGVDFEIKKGEFFGVVGRNGSGKSTLLKLMAGIYAPDKGGVDINGSLIPFIELGVGFNVELSGRDNVYLNGALLGFSRKEMSAMYDDIVKFSELERFMDQKLKNYSSGMQVRLAFSIAVRAKGDILLLDEVLAVGDEDFQRKCNDYFEDIKDEGRTVILVTHNMAAVRRFCNRAMLLEDGKVKAIGDPIDIANQYSLDNLNAGAGGDRSGKRELSKEVKDLSAKLLSSPLLSHKENLKFEINYELNEDTEVDLGFSIIYRGQSIIEHNTGELKLGGKKDTPYSVKYELPLRGFQPVDLEVYVSIFRREGFESIGFNTRAISFTVKNDGNARGGLLNEHGRWIV